MSSLDISFKRVVVSKKANQEGGRVSGDLVGWFI